MTRDGMNGGCFVLALVGAAFYGCALVTLLGSAS